MASGPVSIGVRYAVDEAAEAVTAAKKDRPLNFARAFWAMFLANLAAGAVFGLLYDLLR